MLLQEVFDKCTDLARKKNPYEPKNVVKNWLRLRSTTDSEADGDTEKVVLDVYNHIILEKEDASTAVNNAINV